MSTSDNFLGPPHTVLSLRSDASFNLRDSWFLAGFQNPFCSDVAPLIQSFAFCPWASLKLYWEMSMEACLPHVQVPRTSECVHVSVCACEHVFMLAAILVHQYMLCFHMCVSTAVPVSACTCVVKFKHLLKMSHGSCSVNASPSLTLHRKFFEVFYILLSKSPGGTELWLLIVVVPNKAPSIWLFLLSCFTLLSSSFALLAELSPCKLLAHNP